MKYALVLDGKINELFATDPNFPKGVDIRQVEDGAKVGWILKNGNFVPPPSIAHTFDEMYVKILCKQRIEHVINEYAQRNMMTASLSGWAKEPDHVIAQNVYFAGIDWISDMRETCARLIASRDVTFREDKHWPTPPASFVELAKRY